MTTLLKTIKLKGKGIHSGLPVDIVIRPSKTMGIFFRRVDIDKNKLIAATYDNVGETKMRNTTIGDPRAAHVQTIEHLMAALFIAGVDSAVIDITGCETPIMDGSAKLFVDMVSEGWTKDDVEALCTEYDLNCVYTPVETNTYSEGKIISQSRRVGSTISKGSSLTVEYAIKPKKTASPSPSASVSPSPSSTADTSTTGNE